MHIHPDPGWREPPCGVQGREAWRVRGTGAEDAAWGQQPGRSDPSGEGLAHVRTRSLGADEGEGPAHPTERHSPSAATFRPVAAVSAP